MSDFLLTYLIKTSTNTKLFKNLFSFYINKAKFKLLSNSIYTSKKALSLLNINFNSKTITMNFIAMLFTFTNIT